VHGHESLQLNSGVELPKQVAEQSPLPQFTTAPVHDAEVSRHSIAQGPRLHSNVRSPQPSTPSQISVQA
jgi:hypothetical protein